MTIGWISQALPYLPSRGGFRLYGGNLIPRLSKRHNVELVSLLIDDDADHLSWARQFCSKVTSFPVRSRLWMKPLNYAGGYLFGRPVAHRAEFAAAIREGAKRWDVMHVEGGFVGALVPDDVNLPKVLSLHDAEVLRCKELLQCKMPASERLRIHARQFFEPRFDKLVYPRFDRCVVVADRDQKVLTDLVPKANTILIPYGTDSDYFKPVSATKEPHAVVFHSHLSYAPNVSAAVEFANDVFPLIRREIPDAVFHLIGAKPSPDIRALADRPGISISADLPDLREAVCSGSVYVSAIRYGTGLKSKILEAMAMGLPIVCYPGSTVGLCAVSGKHLLVVDNATEFAASVVDLLRNPDKARQLANAARTLMETAYSWEARARTYEDLYSKIIAEREMHSTAAVAGTADAQVGRS
jgi:glycosyltransferase involved in cell wall biosynthesis